MGMVDPGGKGKEALLAAAKQKGSLADSDKIAVPAWKSPGIHLNKKGE